MANMTFKANLIPASNTVLELGKSGNDNANYWSNIYAKTVTLSQDPVNNLEAVTKQYADNKFIEPYNNTILTDNAIIVGAGNKNIKTSNLSINGTTLSSSNDLFLFGDNQIDLSSDNMASIYGINTVDISTDNSHISLVTSGITISDNTTISLSTPQTTSTSINLTSKSIHINADFIKFPGYYYCNSSGFYRQGDFAIEADEEEEALLALRAGCPEHFSYVDISNQEPGIVISTVDSGQDITIQSNDKINLNGKMILTENINYGTSLPSSGTTGQIFFMYVN